jgi:hypothetical protein
MTDSINLFSTSGSQLSTETASIVTDFHSIRIGFESFLASSEPATTQIIETFGGAVTSSSILIRQIDSANSLVADRGESSPVIKVWGCPVFGWQNFTESCILTDNGKLSQM